MAIKKKLFKSEKITTSGFLFSLSLICFALLAIVGIQNEKNQAIASPMPASSILYQTLSSSSSRQNNNKNNNSQLKQQIQPKKFADLGKCQL